MWLGTWYTGMYRYTHYTSVYFTSAEEPNLGIDKVS